MAKVLQCPQCGHMHPATQLPDVSTFACEQCGQPLKVPDALRPSRSGEVRAPTTGEMRARRNARLSDARPNDERRPVVAPPVVPAPVPTPVPPVAAPRAVRAPRVASAPATAASFGTGSYSAAEMSGGIAVAVGAEPDVAARARRGKPSLAWWMHAIVWLVGLGVGFGITFYGALLIGALNRKQLRGVALQTGFDRYWPLLRLVPVWALISAALIQVTLIAIVRRREQAAAGTRPPRRPRRAALDEDVEAEDAPDGSDASGASSAGAGGGDDIERDWDPTAKPRTSTAPAPSAAPDEYRPIRVGGPGSQDLPPPSRRRGRESDSV
jgi:hypothetical protein